MVHFKTKPKYRRRGDIQRKAHVYDNTQFDHEAIINSSWLEFFFLSLLLLLLLLHISCSSSFYFFGTIFIECMQHICTWKRRMLCWYGLCQFFDTTKTIQLSKTLFLVTTRWTRLALPLFCIHQKRTNQQTKYAMRMKGSTGAKKWKFFSLVYSRVWIIFCFMKCRKSPLFRHIFFHEIRTMLKLHLSVSLASF